MQITAWLSFNISVVEESIIISGLCVCVDYVCLCIIYVLLSIVYTKLHLQRFVGLFWNKTNYNYYVGKWLICNDELTHISR